jgi:glycolate oxidase
MWRTRDSRKASDTQKPDASSNAIIARLKEAVGKGSVLTSKEVLRSYSYDATTNWTHEPDVVVLPVTTSEVSAVIRIANAEKIPVTPRGGGTNLSGGSVPIRGGIVLCTTRMNNILAIDRGDLRATVEPGVGLQALQQRLAPEGMFFPPDPQSFLGATLGGMIAENAGGPACLKYGVTRHYVTGLEVVLASGEIVCLGCRSAGDKPSYNLLDLFVGSEGTLGIVTKAHLRLRHLPEASKTVVAIYKDAEEAGESVFRVLERGIIPSKIEFIDNWILNRIEEMMPLGLPKDADAILLFEVDGSTETVAEEAERIEAVARQYGAREVRVPGNPAEAAAYWAGRKAGFAAVYGYAKTVFLEDVTVPRNRLPDLVRECKEISKRHDVPIVTFGHAGDGNLHPAILTDINDKKHSERAMAALEDLFRAAVRLGGVISGEHGIGLEKQEFFNRTTDPVVLDLMKGIKNLLDPNDIFNPGKM